MRITADADRKPLWTRVFWLIVYWLAGVTAVGGVAAILRFWLA